MASFRDLEAGTQHQEKHSSQREEYAGRPHHHGKARTVIHDALAMVGEFVGTFMFLFMAFMGAQSALLDRPRGANGQPITDNSTILFAALSFGMSLVVTAWAFFRITGSAFNPAVTFSLWLIGNIPLRRALLVVLAQMLGGIAAAGVAKGLTNDQFLVENSLSDGVSSGQGLGIEMFTTALLVFTVLLLAAEKSRTTFLAPVGIGLALFVGHLASIGFTGAGINPARTFGPSVVNGHFYHYTWFYYVGQMLGSFIATVIYFILKHIDYTDAVADIDSSHPDASQDISEGPMGKIMPRLSGEATRERESAEGDNRSSKRVRSNSPSTTLGGGPLHP